MHRKIILLFVIHAGHGSNRTDYSTGDEAVIQIAVPIIESNISIRRWEEMRWEFENGLDRISHMGSDELVGEACTVQYGPKVD